MVFASKNTCHTIKPLAFSTAYSKTLRQIPPAAPRLLFDIPKQVCATTQYHQDLRRAIELGFIIDIHGGQEQDAIIFKDSSRFAHFKMVLGSCYFNFYADNNRRLNPTASALWENVLKSSDSTAIGFDAGAGAGFTAYDMYKAGKVSGKPFSVETTGLSPIDSFIPPELLDNDPCTQKPIYKSDLLNAPFISHQYIGNFAKLDTASLSLEKKYLFIHDSLGAVLYLLLNGQADILDKVVSMLKPGGVFYMSFLRGDMIEALQRPSIQDGCLVGLKSIVNGFELALRKNSSDSQTTGIHQTADLAEFLF